MSSREARAVQSRATPAEIADASRLLEGLKGRERGVSNELRDLLDLARESIVIESPYLVPARAFREGLRRTLALGVHVRILTNSLAATDNLWPQAGYVGHGKELVRGSVELWEYVGPECLHAKAVVIDGETVVVGPYNLDPRSERLNTELALVARDPSRAAETRRTFDGHLVRATKIDARGFPEGADAPYLGTPRTEVLTLRLLRLLAPFIEKQL